MEYTFYNTFMPDSVEKAVIGAAGGKVLDAGVGLLAKKAVAVAPILGRDIGSLAGDASKAIGDLFDNVSGKTDVAPKLIDPVPNKADPALQAEIDRIGQEGHALDRHGEGVTNDQLYTRATTGVAPDGSSVIRKGQVVIPPTSSAFNSNELLAQSDLYIRQNYLERAVALNPPGASQVAIEGVDMGSVVGRGFDRVSASPGAAGPLSFNSQMSRAKAAYVYDPASGVWRTITIYPAK